MSWAHIIKFTLKAYFLAKYFITFEFNIPWVFDYFYDYVSFWVVNFIMYVYKQKFQLYVLFTSVIRIFHAQQIITIWIDTEHRKKSIYYLREQNMKFNIVVLQFLEIIKTH